MKRTLNLFFAALILGSLALTGCNGSQDEGTAGGGSNYASKTRDAGQPIDHTETLGKFEAALKENPNDWQALTALADAYFGLRRFDEAIDYYSKAIDANSEDIDSYNDLALSLHYVGKSSDGLKYVEEGLAKNPYYQRIWLTKGFILAYGTGDLESARNSWEKAKGLDPESQIGKAADDFLVQFSDTK